MHLLALCPKTCQNGFPKAGGPYRNGSGDCMTSLQQTEIDGLTVVKLIGPLNSEGLEAVEAPFESVVNRPGIRAVVDLTNVDIVTTPALSMFISAATTARRSGGKVVFTQAAPPVRDVLQRLRLESVLQTIPGLDDALKAAKH